MFVGFPQDCECIQEGRHGQDNPLTDNWEYTVLRITYSNSHISGLCFMSQDYCLRAEIGIVNSTKYLIYIIAVVL
jgi:hypothetical protein